ncbi:MAG: group II intron reverse transcriptase/maturase [Undibacterium umbellatum]|uniref:group II intron reverse transcriptase/maturase n=1 Tax=Undibacterium umbellatum TaxID=2762300 RepID=UPI003BB74FCD
MSTQLSDFTQWARLAPQPRYNALMGMFSNPDGLYDSFQRQAGNKAAGIDGVSKAEYAQEVDARLAALSTDLRKLSWHPRPARRVFIPKSNGKMRPLGIPCFEDRIVQDRLSGILQAIWEPEFRDCSYGFRPGRNAHQALKQLGEIITNDKTQWLVEADIKGFFDHVDHKWLMKFLAHRIADPILLRVIQRFLKAGVQVQGAFQASEAGTPQGGLVSPVLANIYLHYALDLWFEKRFAKSCKGVAKLVRYADDFVACFTHEEDAKRFQLALTERLAEFALELEPTKTALHRFGCFAKRHCAELDEGRVATFNFLGFTHYVTLSRDKRFALGRKTQKERVSKKLKEVGDRLASLRVRGGRAMMEYAKRHLQGHIAYFGVSGNSRSLRKYVYNVSHLLYKWLNRRSQRKSFNWERFSEVLKRWLPPVRIMHNLYPSRCG